MSKSVEIKYSKHPITIAFKADVYTNAMNNNHLQVSINPHKGKSLISLDIQNIEDVDMLMDKLLDHRNKMT